MKKISPNLLLLVLVSAIALPEAAALLLYKYTGDPTFRPFGISKRSLSKANKTDAMNEVLVQIDWGRGVPATISRDAVRQRIYKAIDIYDIEFRIKIRETTGDEIRVTYIVAHNEFGPYLFQNASRGISAALSAYRSMEKFESSG